MNRVDFYQADTGKLTIPAGGAIVIIEGRVRPELEVTEIIQGGMGKFGTAKLRWQGSEGLTENEIATGKEISIKWVYNNLYSAGGAEGILIFTGRVERIEKEIGPDGEVVEVIARDFGSVLERITVFGRQVNDIDGRIVFLEHAQTVFNEAGSANATEELIEHKGRKVRLFATGTQGAKLWDCADVISYLLCEYVPGGELGLPDEERLQALAGGELVRDLDVTGLNLLDAISKCCEEAGLEFKFVPRLSETGPKQAIVFYRKNHGRSVELNLQQAGEKLSVSKTNIWKAASRKVTPVTHRYTGQGDYKVYEATFNLVKSWRPEEESINYEDYSPSTNPDFYKVKNAFRKWCLNETGDYTIGPYHQGPAYDFSRIFESDKYVHQRRRFWPMISCDSQGKSLGYFLEISYDGEHWWQYLYAFDNLLDECGIWLSSDKLDMRTWISGIKGILKFRITASVVSDERLSCTAANGPVGGLTPVVERIISIPSRFKFRKVTGKSNFAGLTQIADEADDSEALNQYIRRRAQAEAPAIETFDVQTPYLGLGFEVGDIVRTNPDCRDIFSTNDNRSVATIEEVRMDFLKQSTELKVVRRRIF